MKFAQKLSCTIILLVAASFSVGGFLLVWGNFNDSLDEAEAQAERWHLMQRYAMESEVLTRMAQGTEITDENMRSYIESLPAYESESLATMNFIRLMTDESEVYSAFTSDTWADWFPLRGGDTAYELRQADDRCYLLLQNQVNTPVKTYYMQSVNDVTSVFDARDQQLWRLWQMEAVTLVLCAGAAVVLSNRLTKPLKTLSEASTRIAQGEYDVRTELDT